MAKQIAIPKPHYYFWAFTCRFGRECYATWKGELLASVLVSMVTAVIANLRNDSAAWDVLKTALLASAIVLAGYAIWHLARTPYLLHKDAVLGSPRYATLYGVLGIVIVVGILGGAATSGILLWAKFEEIAHREPKAHPAMPQQATVPACPAQELTEVKRPPTEDEQKVLLTLRNKYFDLHKNGSNEDATKWINKELEKRHSTLRAAAVLDGAPAKGGPVLGIKDSLGAKVRHVTVTAPEGSTGISFDNSPGAEATGNQVMIGGTQNTQNATPSTPKKPNVSSDQPKPATPPQDKQ